MWQSKPKAVQLLADIDKLLKRMDIEIVEIYCPICGPDSRVEAHDYPNWECIECGMEFQVKYEEEPDDRDLV
jgi:transposase-like protein